MLYFICGGFRMNQTLEYFYKQYDIINDNIKEKMNSRDKKYSRLIKTKLGKFYFSLTEKQKRAFRDIHSDTDITRYLFNDAIIKEYNKARDNLLLEVANSDVFPFKKENSVNIYIRDGVDTYNALTGESTKDLDVSDNIKKFIQDVISTSYKLEDEYTIDDIPLIKVIYMDFVDNDSISPTYYAEIILQKVKRVHILEKNPSKYRCLSANELKIREAALDKEINELEHSETFSDTLESLKIKKYELLMLEGNRVDELYYTLTNKDDVYPLIKAYLNLIDINYRKNSGYFKSENDVIYAGFETSNKDINMKILEIKKDR